MKKIILLFAILASFNCEAQNFRTRVASSTAVSIAVGRTYPRFVHVRNDGSSIIYINFYAQTATPNPATDVPFFSPMCSPNDQIYIPFMMPVVYSQTKLWVRVVTGNQDTSTISPTILPLITMQNDVR